MILDEEENQVKLSNYYGIWPFLFGLAFGALLIWFMFAYSDGFV